MGRLQRPVAFPPDAIVQLFPGADHPETGVDALIQIPGVWEPTVADDLLGPGSMVICRPTATMRIVDTTYTVPFSLGAAVPGSDADVSDYILVAWWVPGASAAATMRAGKKAKVIDIFGPWDQYDLLWMPFALYAELPDVMVLRADVLLANVQLDEQSRIPFKVFDKLRTTHDVDVSGFSSTHRGNLYSIYVMEGIST